MITINDKQIEWKSGETVLQTAERAGIDIPTSALLKAPPRRRPPAGSAWSRWRRCRGSRRAAPFWPRTGWSSVRIRPASAGAAQYRGTPLASHPDDCLFCPRNGNCELAQIASDLGIRERKYSGIKKTHPIDISPRRS